MSSLETFTGAFYKKFTVVEMKGLLSYFTKQLHLGHNLELGVLRSLLKMAGGYGFADTESIAKLNQSQLDGRGGSLLLKRETSDFGIVTSVDYTSSRNLRTSLQDDSCGVTLLILLSQLKTRILFENAKNKPKQIKLLGSHYDNCQRTMNLLLAFLVDGSEDNKKTQKRGAIQNYAEAIPNLGTILRDFGIAAPTAWMLCRPLLRAATFISQDAAEGTLNEKNVSDLPQYLQNYHPYSEGVIDACREMIPESNWNHITPLVYQRFFTYQISDLFFPEEQYKANIARLGKSIQELEQLQKGGLQAAGMHAARTANAAAAGATQKDIKQAAAFSREDEDKLKQMRFNSDTLGADMKRQKATCESVFNALKGEKDKFFQGLKGENDIVVSTKVFLAKCLYPRCLQSADDALYCAHFVQLLHKIQTPGFHTLQLLDDIVNAMVGALYSTTEDESSCLGIFFEIIWKNICAWRYNSELYEKEVLNTVSILIYLFVFHLYAVLAILMLLSTFYSLVLCGQK
jgi:THO complex subunit 2